MKHVTVVLYDIHFYSFRRTESLNNNTDNVHINATLRRIRVAFAAIGNQ